jgi:hypothetical protein
VLTERVEFMLPKLTIVSPACCRSAYLRMASRVDKWHPPLADDTQNIQSIEHFTLIRTIIISLLHLPKRTPPA